MEALCRLSYSGGAGGKPGRQLPPAITESREMALVRLGATCDSSRSTSGQPDQGSADDGNGGG